MPKAKKQTKKTKEETAPKAAPQADAQQATAGGPVGADLSIGDLKNLATIIDVASTRGAFRANEMATVGVMFNKLSAFLARVAPEKTEADDATADAPATTEEKK